MATPAHSLVEPVLRRAHEHPAHPTLVFIAEDGGETRIDAAAFHAGALRYAGLLAGIGITPGDLVVLVMRHSLDLLFGFWGALYLGAVPSIFPFLSEKLDPEIYRERVRLLVEHAGVKVVITLPELEPELAELLAPVGGRVVTTADVHANGGEEILPDPAAIGGESIAFLQHSSG
ncbi:MAG: AMP-binding protein, partial [Anaerolineae bacterium]|nr:AMP-binding protein [Anaerolineae bacterium]